MDHAQIDARCLISPHDDRRTFQRFATNILVFVRLPEGPPPCLSDRASAYDETLHTFQAVAVRDISMTGLFFSSRLVYPSEAELEVCLCLDGVEYVVPAMIERRVRVNNQLCGYGISFRQSRISKDLRVALAAFLLRQAAHTKSG